MISTAKKGFTLVELMIVLAIIAIVATLAITNLASATKSGNEVAAVKSLRAIAEAEAIYKKTVNPGNYGLALTDLVDNGKPMVPPDVMAGASKGYTFAAIAADENGNAYTTATGFAFYAIPTTYNRTGNNTFIMDDQGTVYQSDNGGAAVAAWPAADPTTAGWTVAN